MLMDGFLRRWRIQGKGRTCCDPRNFMLRAWELDVN